MNLIARGTIAVVFALTALVATSGTSHAGLDNELSLVDGQDRTLTIQQWDTFLNGVFPLDRNRLTREWFHSGSAVYNVAGPGSDEFEGTLELGYQIGFPWSLGVGINFSYTTPNILIDDGNCPVSIRSAARSSPRTCSRVCRSALTWVTARASRRWRPSRLTWRVRTARWRSPTRMAR